MKPNNGAKKNCKLFLQENITIVFFPRVINRLTPNDPYMGRTAPLTSKRCILYIYSTNIGTEYFKHALYSPFFFSSKCSLFHNANLFGSCIIHIFYTGCAKIKKIIPAPKVNKQNLSSMLTLVQHLMLHEFLQYLLGAEAVGRSVLYACSC